MNLQNVIGHLLKYDYEDFYKLKDIPKSFVLQEDRDDGLDEVFKSI